MRRDSEGVSQGKSRTLEFAFHDESEQGEMAQKQDCVSRQKEKIECHQNDSKSSEENPPIETNSQEENVYFFKSFLLGFEHKLHTIQTKKLRLAFQHLHKLEPKRVSISTKMVCNTEKQLLENIDNFLFKTEPMIEERESSQFSHENQKIESIQQLEGFDEMESILRSALSKQISNKKSGGSNSKVLFSSKKSNRGSQRGSHGLSVRVSVGSSFRGSGKSIQMQVASPINADQLMKELIFSKKNAKTANTKGANVPKKESFKDEGKDDCVWNEASTKQSLYNT